MKQRFSKRTRLVSALLTLAMVFTFLPLSALAANTASTEIDFNSPDFALEFPDAEFRRFLRDCCDTNYDGKLDVDIKSMTIPTSYEIKSLKGIQLFEALEKLDCHGIGLTTLNVSMNFKLKELDCSGNQLKEYLPILSSGLKKLNCSNNKLTHMNLGIRSGLNVKNSIFLVTLNCSANQLTELDADVTHKSRLVSVECQNNQLTSLILGQNKLLEKLNCAHNQLTQLNLDNMSALEELNCFDNQLTVLDVSSSQNLTKLWLGDNHLTSLNLDNNPNLNFSSTDIYSGENVYTVTLNPDRTFDLRNLPGNFDVTRVTGWEYGKANGYILTVDEGTNVVYYAYKCRSDIMEISFKLNVTGTGGSTGGSTGGGSTGGGTVPPVTPPSGGGSTIPPEAGKYQLTVTDGVATVNGSTGAVLNVTPGDTVTLTADTTKFPENEEFGWWEISPYGSVSNTLTGQYQRTATFTMPPENVSARAMSKTAGVSTGGDDGGGAAILLVGGAAVAGLVGYGV